jgi:hypothetical protein
MSSENGRLLSKFKATKRKFQFIAKLVTSFIRNFQNERFRLKFLSFIDLRFNTMIVEYTNLYPKIDIKKTKKNVIAQERIRQDKIKNDFDYVKEIFLFNRLFDNFCYDDENRLVAETCHPILLQKLKTIFLVFLNYQIFDSVSVNLSLDLWAKLSEILNILKSTYKVDVVSENELFMTDETKCDYIKCKIFKMIIRIKKSLYDHLLYFYVWFLSDSNINEAFLFKSLKNKVVKLSERDTKDYVVDNELPLLNVKWEDFEFKPIEARSKKGNFKGARMRVSCDKVVYEYQKVLPIKNFKKVESKKQIVKKLAVFPAFPSRFKLVTEDFSDRLVRFTPRSVLNDELKVTEFKNETEEILIKKTAKLLAEKCRKKILSRNKEEILVLLMNQYSKHVSLPVEKVVFVEKKKTLFKNKTCFSAKVIEKENFISKL